LIKLKSLNGPAVRFALEQFRAYLERFPGGLHRVEAQRKYDICRDLLSQYHSMVGDYYVQVGNNVGAMHHFALAAGEVSKGDASVAEFVQGTYAADEAKKRLAKLRADS